MYHKKLSIIQSAPDKPNLSFYSFGPRPTPRYYACGHYFLKLSRCKYPKQNTHKKDGILPKSTFQIFLLSVQCATARLIFYTRLYAARKGAPYCTGIGYAAKPPSKPPFFDKSLYSSMRWFMFLPIPKHFNDFIHRLAVIIIADELFWVVIRNAISFVLFKACEQFFFAVFLYK